MQKTPVISLKNVNYAYEEKTVLENINFELQEGSFMGLLGPNGGGKTTLIKLVLGLLKPTSGTVELYGKPASRFKNKHLIGFVSQKSNAFNKGFPATVYEVVSMGLTAKIGYMHFFTKKHKKIILDAIDQVGMAAYKNRNIGELSGGQQQRVFIARALVSKPKLLILDEPTVGVDSENVQRFYELLHRLNVEKGITMLLITHDTGIITQYATDIACLNKHIHFHGKPDDYIAMNEADLSNLYGHPINKVVHDH
ncbi:metal ABC transporter ATP-binding protein [Virgibacillus sp. 179-BFC.A HS]|uniref:Metal ABC transporter ATP-binding protein n=1 Tax=Tigheibacillus jepli TaxID=3035914 RepID=A0ABU5CI60_9BACI|nr:metal ABC transporter ATP-binding protein [Virgibacillus sp. 179-BFC.A HS]MDY0405203.1 metal ABC transporter ATP-binding protein [Virgibacillus sp. 179-BFC.A HS]